MSIIKQTLDRHAATASKVWSHDRMNTVGASEIGQCMRKIFWLKNEDDQQYAGVERDVEYVETWGARMRGTVFEDAFWEPALRARFGNRLLFAGKEQRTFVDNFLSATPDGMLVELTAEEQAAIGVKSGCVMVECKTADPRTNLVEPKAENVYQTQVQMGIIRKNTPYQPTHSILSYTDASFWSDVKEFMIAFDPTIYEAAIERAAVIMTTTDVADVQPEGWIAGGKECNHCPFTKACGVQRRNLPFADIVPIDPQFAAEIADMARELRIEEGYRDQNEARVRQLQNDIKDRLREKGVRKIPGIVTWSSVKGRNGYDNRAIKQAAVEAGVDIRQFETQGEASDRLTILIGSSTDEPMPGSGTSAAV